MSFGKSAFLIAVLWAAVPARGQWSATEEDVFSSSFYRGDDHLGTSVAMDGDTVVAGAPGRGPNIGAAVVFAKSGSGWIEQAQLASSDPDPGDQFGWRVAVEGDRVVVGSSVSSTKVGLAEVFVRSGATWTREASLQPGDGQPGDAFGSSVAISGETILVGARYRDPGVTYVFVWDGAAWVEQAELVAKDGQNNDEFGAAVALEGDTALIGATHFYGWTGAVYWFQRTGTTWTEMQKLTGSGTRFSSRFGYSIDLEGDTALIGAPAYKVAGPGSAFFFERNGSSWVEDQKFVATSPFGDLLGVSVAIDGDKALIGASQDDNAGGTLAGAAYLLGRVDGVWSEQAKLTASDAQDHDEFGASVGLEGTRAVIGALSASLPQAADAGVVYEFKVWPQAETYCTAGTSAIGCQALLGTIGGPSASEPSGFTVVASTVEAQKDGLFYFGVNGRQAQPWGAGTSLQCVVPPVTRTGLLLGNGSFGTCEGMFARDLNAYWCPTCPAPQKNPGAGTVVQAQFWYRDPFSTSVQTTSLSNAIEFQLDP